jgi:nucleotidyltransferase substrate binding protein (TIGR01987 family)
MDKKIRFKQRLQNLEKTASLLFARLNEISSISKEHKYYEALQMALVQAFEMNVEMAWKCLKDYLESEGYTELKSPKAVFRQAFQATILSEGEIWLSALEKRNLSSHLYDETIISELTDFIIKSFGPALQRLLKTLEIESQ